MNFLLASHVFLVVLGYTTTFLVGALGVCFVAQRCLSDFSPFRMRSLTRVTFLLGCVAASLTAVGIILGMFWAKTEWGRYWEWDKKEIGAFVVFCNQCVKANRRESSSKPESFSATTSSSRAAMA